MVARAEGTFWFLPIWRLYLQYFQDIQLENTFKSGGNVLAIHCWEYSLLTVAIIESTHCILE